MVGNQLLRSLVEHACHKERKEDEEQQALVSHGCCLASWLMENCWRADQKDPCPKLFVGLENLFVNIYSMMQYNARESEACTHANA